MLAGAQRRCAAFKLVRRRHETAILFKDGSAQDGSTNAEGKRRSARAIYLTKELAWLFPCCNRMARATLYESWD